MYGEKIMQSVNEILSELENADNVTKNKLENAISVTKRKAMTLK